MVNNCQQRVLFDANSGVPATDAALQRFADVEHNTPGNPAAIHQDGRAANAVIERAKINIAELFGCQANELFFTSGATEANNLGIHALISGLEQRFNTKPILVSSKAEHPSCLSYLRMLQQKGYRLHLLDLDQYARFDINQYSFNDSECYLIVGQWVNNETGAVQDIEACRAKVGQNIYWHCDAVQGIGKLSFDDAVLGSSSFSLSGHKLGSPKGVGLLRISDHSSATPMFFGGGQQGGLRPGTESPALVASFATALNAVMCDVNDFIKTTDGLKKVFLKLLKDGGINYQLNSPATDCLSNTLNISFPGIDGRMLLPALDVENISISSGSACASGAALASSVLVACGVPEKLAQASIRLSFTHNYQAGEAEAALARLVNTVSSLYKVANP
jgi:cysteine desulfurase